MESAICETKKYDLADTNTENTANHIAHLLSALSTLSCKKLSAIITNTPSVSQVRDLFLAKN